MPLTKVQIISSAVNLLNKGPITSIAGAGNFTTSAEDTFDYLLPSEISKHDWRFATAIAQLSRLVQTPIIDNYEYIYALPADYLTLVRLYPQTYDFQIYQNSTLYANATELKIEYRFVPDVTRLPSYFVEYFIDLLASRLALTGAASETLAADLIKMASEKKIEAMAVDAKAHPNIAIVDSPLIDIRNGSQFPAQSRVN
ncbi:MAG: hypothetical protein ACTSP4_00525 [Candidatus Hodarchaeales archaeon]